MTIAPQAGRPWPRLVASAALLTGLVVFSMTLLLMAVVSAEADAVPLRRAEALQVNETAALTYALPPSYERHGMLVGPYAFRAGPGDVLLLSCADYDRFRAGAAPFEPAVVAQAQTEGRISLAASAWPTHDVWFAPSRPPREGEWPGLPPAPPPSLWCERVFVVLSWPGNASDVQQWPQADLVVERNPLDEPEAVFVVAIMAAGAALAIGGGFALTRTRARPTPDEAPEGAAEVLLRLAEATTAWLERTRRYLILSGVLGLALWYPVLIPLAWGVGRHGSDAEWMPWLLASIALLLLAGMTFLWAREFTRLDRELERWRVRVERIRARKEDLLASLEQDA